MQQMQQQGEPGICEYVVVPTHRQRPGGGPRCHPSPSLPQPQACAQAHVMSASAGPDNGRCNGFLGRGVVVVVVRFWAFCGGRKEHAHTHTHTRRRRRRRRPSKPTHASHRLTFAKRASGVGFLVRLFPQRCLTCSTHVTRAKAPLSHSLFPPQAKTLRWAGGLLSASRTCPIPSFFPLCPRWCVCIGPPGFVVLFPSLLFCNVASYRGWGRGRGGGGGVGKDDDSFPPLPFVSLPPHHTHTHPPAAARSHPRPCQCMYPCSCPPGRNETWAKAGGEEEEEEQQQEEQESAVAGGTRPDQTRNQTDTDHRPPTADTFGWVSGVWLVSLIGLVRDNRETERVD